MQVSPSTSKPPSPPPLDSSLQLRLLTTYRVPSLDCASSLAILPNGNLLLADTGRHRLVILSQESGKVLSTFGENLRGPRGVAVDADAQCFFLADCYACCIRKFALDGALLNVTGRYGEAEGELRYPHGVALAPDGTLYVSDSGNGRIVALAAADLSFRFCFYLERRPKPPPRPSRLSTSSPGPRVFPTPREAYRPAGLAVYGDEIFVVDSFNHRLQVFSLEGTFRRCLTPTVQEGTSRGQLLLELPDGVTAADGRLFVSDRRGDAVHVLAREDGRLLQAVPFLMHRPHGLAGVCTDGLRVFVVDELRNEVVVLTSLEADATRKSVSERHATPRVTPRAASPKGMQASGRSTSRTPRGTPRGTPRVTPAPRAVVSGHLSEGVPEPPGPGGASRQPLAETATPSTVRSRQRSPSPMSGTPAQISPRSVALTTPSVFPRPIHPRPSNKIKLEVVV